MPDWSFKAESFASLCREATKGDAKSAYDAGYDCGRNGANGTNCHFSLFSTPEKTREWERGKTAGEREKEAS